MLPSKRIIVLYAAIAGVVFLFLGLNPTTAPAPPPHHNDLSRPPQPPPVRPGRVPAGEIETVGMKVSYLQEASWSQTLHRPGASFIKVHFRKLDLLPGDLVTVSDPAGLEVYTYPGVSDYTTDEGPGFWALSVMGDTVVVELHPGQGGGAAGQDNLQQRGLEIDKLVRGFPAGLFESQPSPESTCGTNQRLDVACYQGSHPTEFGLSSAVARLLITTSNGSFFCTGWRVGPNNRMFTNEHCITRQADVNGTEVRFNFQRNSCAGTLNPGTVVSGNKFLADNATLDYALFTVNSFGSISGFGNLLLDIRTPVLNEEIYIPQHGNGNPKEFGIESDMDSGNVCRVNKAVTNGLAANTDTGYFCDTTGGSSGSPVLARASHRVIALHHFGTGQVNGFCSASVMNTGVRIDRIFPQVQLFLNDEFSHAALADGVAFSQDTGDATVSADDPTFSCGSFSGQGSHTVWYRYTPSQNGSLQLNTLGSSYDTVLAVWTGNRGSLQLRACNDDSDGTLQSKVQLAVSSGTTYHIEVAGFSAGSSGFLHLSRATSTVYVPLLLKQAD